MKSGFTTSEFYMSLGTGIAGILVMTGILTPDRSSEIASLIATAIGGVVAIAALISYILSRTELKARQTQAPKIEG